jgi:hypothetical protein
MTEKNAINVRNFNSWLWTVACEAGSIVEQDETRGFCFIENDVLRFEAPTLLELLEKIDASGLLGQDLLEELSETFELNN